MLYPLLLIGQGLIYLYYVYLMMVSLEDVFWMLLIWEYKQIIVETKLFTLGFSIDYLAALNQAFITKL